MSTSKKQPVESKPESTANENINAPHIIEVKGEKKMTGSILPSYTFDPKEAGLVHVKIKQLNQFKEQSRRTGEREYPTVIKKLSPNDFLKIFAINLEQNGKFKNINSPAVFARVVRNVDEKQIEKRFRRQLRDLENEEYDIRVQDFLKDIKRPLVNGGGKQILDDILHIPTIKTDPKQGLDLSELDTFPESV